MMSYLSNERHKLGCFQTFVKSGKGIMIDYLIANAVYLVWINHSFDMKTYLQHVVSFDMAGPFYYVLLYMQLMLISRLMYGVVKKLPERKAWFWEIGVGIVILFISALTTNYTNIFDIYGGGGKVLGGTHVEDGLTMMLIPTDLHNAVRHTGGASLIRYLLSLI